MTYAPLLMDGRRKTKNQQTGVADEVNAKILEKLSLRTGVPIAGLRARHDVPKGVEGAKLDSDEFWGLEAWLYLCVGARVLLTQNLWVEAGLLNGALGVVRGFVWPEGGDPRSKDKSKTMPYCVVVDFDDVTLGVDERGTRRSFFPEDPSRARWVPIFGQTKSSNLEENVSREQFPLTLAWALTHWKAQGMTLRRARVHLGQRTVRIAGIAFVAVTRVKHPSHLVFEQDLPDWEVFQAAMHTANFRGRQRFELRLQAAASRTLRRYGFCAADRWTRDDAAMAEELLRWLQARGARERAALRQTGMPTDRDAWLWPGTTPDYVALLDEACDQFGLRPDDGGLPVVRAERSEWLAVANRLLGEYHMPAVRKALGTLIPEALHPRLDGRKPGGEAWGGGGARGCELDDAGLESVRVRGAGFERG